MRVLGRGMPGVDLEDRDFMGGEPRKRDPAREDGQDQGPGSPEDDQDQGPGSPDYPQGPGSPKYPTPAGPRSPRCPTSSRPGSPKYPTPTRPESPKFPVGREEAGSSTPDTTEGSAPCRRLMVGEPVYSVPGTSTTTSPATGVEVIRPRASVVEKLERARADMALLREDWESEGEKSSPDSGLGQPEPGARRRSPAASPALRPGWRGAASAAATSTSGLSSGTAGSVCGSTGG